MKKVGILIGLLVFASCLAEVDIVKDGKSNAVIFIPKTSSRAVVFAAEELRKHLEKRIWLSFLPEPRKKTTDYHHKTVPPFSKHSKSF